MPLIEGKPLPFHAFTKSLQPNEPVFHCKETSEIFKDYNSFSNRVMACKSLIWTCAMTGKKNLTFSEALQSEEAALSSMKMFPMELSAPILFIASLSERKSFNELDDDIFGFVSKRYFIGETVEVNFLKKNWIPAKVIQVILPTPEEVVRYANKLDINHPIHYRPYPAELYKYKVEEVTNDNETDDCIPIQCSVLDSTKLRRIKGLYTKTKSRVFLKQFVEEKPNKIWGIKDTILNKYRIHSLCFSDLFVGDSPIFHATNAVSVSLTDMGKARRIKVKKQANESKKIVVSSKIKKVMTSPSDSPKTVKKSKLDKLLEEERLKKVKYEKEEQANLLKQQNREKLLEERRLRREKLKNEKEKLANFAKEWRREREDLECDDLRELPQPYAIDCRFPNACFGEALTVLEFLSSFSHVLNIRKYFPSGLTFAVLERALVDVEIAGPFYDMLKFLLQEIFKLQNNEHEVRHLKSQRNISLDEPENMTTQEALDRAYYYACWSTTHHGLLLEELHFDEITVTDILRLHLLSSGCQQERSTTLNWRSTDRGGYTSSEDPGVELRLREPHILRFLSTKHAVALPAEDKLKILNCLINQILTYHAIRSQIDKRCVKAKSKQNEFRVNSATEMKRERVIIKELKDIERSTDVILEGTKLKLTNELERIKMRNSDKSKQIHKACMSFQMRPLGQDRGYRRYWAFSSIAGLFVEDNELWPGDCLPNSTPCPRASVTVNDDDDTMTYIRKLYDACRQTTGSDKENACDNKVSMSPTGIRNLEQSPPGGAQKLQIKPGLRCTANIDTCLVHNVSIERTKWLFFFQESDIDELIQCLNRRGVREQQLRNQLIVLKRTIYNDLPKCPVQLLNRFVPIEKSTKQLTDYGTKYVNANYGFTKETPVEEIIEKQLRNSIINFEMNMHSNKLGKLHVSNRQTWCDAIINNGYDKQDLHLAWPTTTKVHRKEKEDQGSSESDNDSSRSLSVSRFSDKLEADQPTCVCDLACAVLQLGRAVNPKYFKKPIPHEPKWERKLTALEFWELSLMKSTSLTQVYLHLMTLEKSVKWNKVVQTFCANCQRSNDPNNLVPCDSCMRSYHIYCTRPKLSRIPHTNWSCEICALNSGGKRSRGDHSETSDDEDILRRSARILSKKPKRK